jgi:hypothetical protein
MSSTRQTVESFCLLATAEPVGPKDEIWLDSCPYCLSRLGRRPFDTAVVSDKYRNRGVDYCAQCGWWRFSENWESCNTHHTTDFCSILQSFDLAAAAVPVDVLEMELPKWLSKIGSLHPRRMEDLISRILSGAWDCEVRHLGYTRDGGIDLIALTGVQQIAVQVKRRESATKREQVSPIRDFLGAALLSGHKKLLYVTTAPAFTKASRDVALISMEKGLVESFELMSMDGVRELIPSMPNRNPWDYAVARANSLEIPVPQVPSPYRQIARRFPSPKRSQS